MEKWNRYSEGGPEKDGRYLVTIWLHGDKKLGIYEMCDWWDGGWHVGVERDIVAWREQSPYLGDR